MAVKVKSADPSKEAEPDKSPPSVRVLAVVNFPAEVAVVAVVALPESAAVIVPAAKSPFSSLITNLLAVSAAVASASFVLSAPVIMEPDPAEATSLKAVMLARYDHFFQ